MQLRQLYHLKKKEMQGISTIGNSNNYRRRKLKQQTNINYKNEYDRLVGELSQTNLPYDVRHKIEQRQKVIKQVYQDNQIAKYILFPWYIYICQISTE